MKARVRRPDSVLRSAPLRDYLKYGFLLDQLLDTSMTEEPV